MKSFRILLAGGLLALLILSGAPAVVAQPQRSDPAWKGEYFNNINFSGLPVMTRDDAAIDFDWGTGSPGGGVPADNFSVRWTRYLDLPAGNTRFTVTADDGVRLWVDGQLLIDHWGDQPATTYSAEVWLTAGNHLVRMEYYEHWDRAVARLSWGSGGTYADWKGEYFDNPDLSGSPVLTRNDPTIDFDWGQNAPALGISADNFSVRWSRFLNLPDGNVRFTVTADDGVRLWVDGHLFIDQWHDQPPTTYTADVWLAAGSHVVQMEYYEHSGGAVARLSWNGSGGTYPDWKGEYFNNTGLSGSPAHTRNDSAIAFDWGSGSPAPGVGADNFSVRWTRRQHFDANTYRFTVTTDDGARLWVDGRLLIDQWHDQAPTAYSSDIWLAAGEHDLKMEYYERGGGAVARLDWSPISSGGGPWTAEYYNNRTLSGSPLHVAQVTDLDFDWGGGSPGYGLGADDFSIRWTRNADFSQSGDYTFYARTDDGVRLWVDGAQVINAWQDQSATTHSGSRYLSAGQHQVKVEYYEHGGVASAKVWWELGGGGSAETVVVDERGFGFKWGGTLAGRLEQWVGYNGHSYWTYNNAYNVINYGQWEPVLSRAGNYEVYAYIPPSHATTRYARYRIIHNGGQRHDRVINQYAYSNQWVSLGTYYFNAAGGEFVFLADNTHEYRYTRYIGYDAVKFVPR